MKRYAVVPALVLGALVAQTGLAPPAHAAAQRYVTTTGTGTACTFAAPCSLETAVNSAAAGDEVIITPGTYATGTSLSRNVANLNIHGVPLLPKPVLVSSAARAIDFGQSAFGTRISDLVILHSGGAYGLNVFARNTTISRVEVRSTGAVACSPGISGLLRDSTCVTSAAGGIAVDDSWGGNESGTLFLRNVTAIATGAGSVGIRADANGSGTNLDIDARNVIAAGWAADVRATESGSNMDSDVVLRTSNYDLMQEQGGGSVTDPGTNTNQTVAPVYAETVSFHQAVGSPTINAGSTFTGMETRDVDGEPRVYGTAPDIGADEFDPTPPDTSFTRTPKGKTRSKKVTFAFAATEPATFLCKVDKNKAKACSSPFKVKAKRYGKHTITVTAVDTIGNVEPAPATYTWKRKHKKKRR